MTLEELQARRLPGRCMLCRKPSGERQVCDRPRCRRQLWLLYQRRSRRPSRLQRVVAVRHSDSSPGYVELELACGCRVGRFASKAVASRVRCPKNHGGSA